MEACRAFKVWLGIEHINTVIYPAGDPITAEEVKASLISREESPLEWDLDQGGYPPNIQVVELGPDEDPFF